MSVDIGRLRKRITFMKYQESENEYLQTVQGLVNYKTVWASVEPTTAKEIIEAGGKLEGEITHKIYIRYRSDITTDMFINYHGRKFEIVAPPIDTREEHILLTILCKEKVGELIV